MSTNQRKCLNIFTYFAKNKKIKNDKNKFKKNIQNQTQKCRKTLFLKNYKQIKNDKKKNKDIHKIHI